MKPKSEVWPKPLKLDGPMNEILAKTYVSEYSSGHDVTAVFFNPDRDEFVAFEFERLSEIKHHRANKSLDPAIIDRIKDQMRKQFWPVDQVDHAYVESFYSDSWMSRLKPKSKQAKGYSHHECHCSVGFASAPFSSALVLSIDGGGDSTSFCAQKIKDGFFEETTYNHRYHFGYVYNIFSIGFSILKGTPMVDVAGKVMGLSAYGIKYKDQSRVQEMIESVKNSMDSGATGSFRNSGGNENWFTDFKHWRDQVFDRNNTEDQMAMAYAIQQGCQEKLIEIIRDHYIDAIRECGGNLILSGGVALNVLANEEVKRQFPDIRVWVPPCPDDRGLALGQMARRFIFWNARRPGTYGKFWHKLINEGYDFKYIGPYVEDINRMPAYVKKFKGRKTHSLEVARLLRLGKIIGMVQGRAEHGPRALGNRSILCDPSYPDMKDRLNAEVKFREWFRPFAPMCRLEEAPQHFVSRDYQDMDSMQFAVPVREESKEMLSAITHVDGTARLQTVRRSVHPRLHDLLTQFRQTGDHGVLLNTSFNVQGKPILNEISVALDMLKKTGLDHVVVYDEKDYWIFDAENIT